jgi:hypothetical protein
MNSYQQNSTKNTASYVVCDDDAQNIVAQESGTTLLIKVSSKNEIIISADQLREATWLFRQYGLVKPGWLRKQFLINQRRRKLLNDTFREAGMDGLWCGKLSKTDDWVSLLHGVWHEVNGRPPCI